MQSTLKKGLAEPKFIVVNTKEDYIKDFIVKKKIKKGSTDLALLQKNEDGVYIDKDSGYYSGKYHWYYPSGIIAEEGRMLHGILHGTVSLYNEDGVLLVEAEYHKGLKNGKVTTYYPSGHLKSVYNLVEGKREGKMRIWYENGGKKYDAFYQNDLLEGKQVKYFKDGKINFTVNYKENKMHGKKVMFNEEGRVFFEGEFEDGELI